MAITDAQKVDYLYKKVGFGVSKTDTSAYKSPSNESNPSPLLMRGDTILVNTNKIPGLIPSSNSSVVAVHNDALSSTIECTLDNTVSGTNRTWLTNQTNWIPPEFGSSYQVKVYAANAGDLTPQSGIQLFADGSGNSDSWFFDYQSGILNFADTNVPTALTGKKIFISGARYTGYKGIDGVPSLTIGNITINGDYISGWEEIYFNTNTHVGNAFVTNSYTNKFYWANTAPVAFTYYTNANVTSYLPVHSGDVSAATLYTDNITGVTGSLTITPAGNLVIFNSTGAVQLSTGNSATRPSDATTGSVRFNIDINSPEYYGGATWVPIGPAMIASQVIEPDGNTTYTLDKAATATGIMVSINGTVQQPGVAYTVSGGTNLTFAEAPLSTDIIEIRFLSAALVLEENSGVVSTAPITVGTSLATVDSFDKTVYRSARYTVTATDPANEAQITEIYVVHNGTSAAISYGSNTFTSANVITYSAQVSSNQVNLNANGVVAGTAIRIQKLYFQA